MTNTTVTMMAFLVKTVLALLTTFGMGPKVNGSLRFSFCLRYKTSKTLPYKSVKVENYFENVIW